jgi:hypothetical protein
MQILYLRSVNTTLIVKKSKCYIFRLKTIKLYKEIPRWRINHKFLRVFPVSTNSLLRIQGVIKKFQELVSENSIAKTDISSPGHTPIPTFPVSHTTWCTLAALAVPTSRMARTITRVRYTILFDRSSQRTERRDGTIPCPRERGSSRTPPCKQGCPQVYPQPSKKISLGTCWSHLVYLLNRK